jgi:multiple sugar transport system substrate-binding protein
MVGQCCWLGRHRARLVLGLALLLVATSCLAPDPGQPPARYNRGTRAASAAEGTTITWSTWGNAWMREINRRVVRAFEAEHPGLRVELVQHPWEEYFTWLSQEWAAGRSPDVMMINYVPARAQQGMLADLEPWLARDGLDLSDFYPTLLALFRYQGALHGLPRDNDTKVIYYNQAAFEQAGLPYPRPGWNWDDLRALAHALTVRDAAGAVQRYGFAFEASLWWRIWVWQNGGDLVDDPLEPRQFRLDSPESLEALEFLASLAVEDRSTPPPELLSTEAIRELFLSGRLAMAFGNHGHVPFFAEATDLRWDVVGLPRRRAAVNFAGGAGYSMARTTAAPEAAWALVKFLTGPKGQAMFAESGLTTPGRRSVREDHVFLRRQPYNPQVFLEETALGRPDVHAYRGEELNALLDRALLPVWRGELAPAVAVRAVRPDAERLLAAEGSAPTTALAPR